jgi:cytochrome c oxidase cbb3-type subunit III
MRTFVSLMLTGLLLTSPVHATDISTGAQLFSQHCASCHGSDGKGGTGVPLANKSFQEQVSNHFLFSTIRYGRPGRVMPGFSQLSDAEIQAIVAHVRGFTDAKPPKEDHQPVSGDIARGKELFHNHCAACHGADGKGGKGTGVTFSRPRDLPIIAPALNNYGFLKSATDQMIKNTLMQGREGTPMPSFIKQGLKNQDIDDLVAYIRNFERYQENVDVDKYKNEPLMIESESPYDLATTIENIKRSAVGKNFRIIRVQELDNGLVAEGKENKSQVIIYFCNFQSLNEALAIDTRVGLFLPCRITVVETAGKVKVMSINPKRLSYLFNNDELNKLCTQMHDSYVEIIEEANL